MFHHAILLAAGRGSRFGLRTEIMPKALVDVYGRPLIHYSLLPLLKQVSQVTVTVGYHGDQLREALRLQGVDSFIDTTGEGNAWWIFHSAFRTLDEPVLVLPCDLITPLDCRWLFATYERWKSPAFLQIPVAHPPGLAGDFMEEEQGRVTAFSRAGGTHYCSGLSILNPARLNRLLPFCEDLPTICRALVKLGALYCSESYPYPWYSVNTEEELKQATNYIEHVYLSHSPTGRDF